MSTITEIPGVELEVPRRTGSPGVTPIETARAHRPATDRGIWVVLALCSLLFAGMFVAQVLMPAVQTVTSASSEDYPQAP